MAIVRRVSGEFSPWYSSRLHIPAGILRIPEFSVPMACFSQESQFLFRRNLVFRNKRSKNLRSKTKASGHDHGVPRVPSGTVLQLLRLEVVKLDVATTLVLLRVEATRLK